MKPLFLFLILTMSIACYGQNSRKINIGKARYETIPNCRIKGITQSDTCYDGKNYKSVLRSTDWNILMRGRDCFWDNKTIKVFAACSEKGVYTFYYFVKPILKP